MQPARTDGNVDFRADVEFRFGAARRNFYFSGRLSRTFEFYVDCVCLLSIKFVDLFIIFFLSFRIFGRNLVRNLGNEYFRNQNFILSGGRAFILAVRFEFGDSFGVYSVADGKQNPVASPVTLRPTSQR